MKKCVRFMLFLLSLVPLLATAKECDWSEISAKKNLAKEISWSYEYYLDNNNMYFDVTATNVFEDLYVVDETTGNRYTKGEFIIKKLSDNQKLVFDIYSKDCEEQIATKDISLPAYNKYYGTEYCKGISEYTYCKKWQTLSSSITEEVLKNKTNEYRKSLEEDSTEIIRYGTNSPSFYIFSGIVIFALILLLIFIIRGRREKDFI